MRPSPRLRWARWRRARHPGRLGNDDLQADVRLDLVKADADLICESFNQGPARWLTSGTSRR